MSGRETLADMLLDRSMVGGYTRLGYTARSRHWSQPANRPLAGKVVLVTGASSGLGRAAAEGFAAAGASVRLLVRDHARGESVRSGIIARTGTEDARVVVCDLSDLSSVRRLAEELRTEHDRLDVLVNNAGVLRSERTLSVDEIELTLATNVVGPFLLTKLLSELLAQSAPARVINVSSGGMYAQRIDVDDLQSARGRFHGTTVYARTKRAQVILTELWADRLRGRGVVVNAMHPGWVDTPGLKDSLPGFHKLVAPLLRTPQQGADTIVWLGSAPEAGAISGAFWHDRARRPVHLAPWTKETAQERQRLWTEVERLSEAA